MQTPSSTPLVMFGGSRALPSSELGLVSQVVQAALERGFFISVGCAKGADQLALSAVLAAGAADRLSVFAIGSSSGNGFWSGSAPLEVLRAAQAAGASVVWQAGGSARVPFRARLLRRSLAALQGAAVACFFLASPSSAGSLNVAAKAAAAGCQVFAFACGFSGAPAPLSGQAGQWVPGSLARLTCWRWQPAAVQEPLF